MDATRIMNELGWKPLHTFEQGIVETIRWYVEHEQWWRGVMSGEYMQYYRKQYSET
jgi:dTDP-glucose 4,6-dehydratase